jgi:transcriptional regulator with XRE-family HTH domain
MCMFCQWLKNALKEKGIGQAELARRLTNELGRNFDRSMVNKMVNGRRPVAGDELLAIEKITGLAAPKLATQPQTQALETVVAGMIGAFQALRPAMTRDAAEELAKEVLEALEGPLTGADPQDFESARRVVAATVTHRFLKSRGI